MTNDASTIVEKYQTPMMKPEEEMDDDEDMDMEEEMSDFASVDSVELPTVWLNTKQLPGAQGLVVGDKVYLMVEAEVYNHLVSENSEGVTRDEYTFKLKKGCVKKDD